MSVWETIPKGFISVECAAKALHISEQEVIDLLRSGEIEGVYNPVWNFDSPCWYVQTGRTE